MLPRKDFIEYLFQESSGDQRPIEYSIRYGAIHIVKKLFDMKEIRDKFDFDADDNFDNLYRLLYHLFAYNRNEYLIDYMLSCLDLSADKLIKIMYHQCPAPTYTVTGGSVKYHRLPFIHGLVHESSSIKILKKLHEIIGDTEFITQVFRIDDYNHNAVEKAVKDHKLSMIKHLLSFKEIKDKTCNDNELIWRLTYILFALCQSMDIRKCVVTELSDYNIKDKLGDAICSLYSGDDEEKGEYCTNFANYSIMDRAASWRTVDSLKDILSIVGQDKFCDGIFLKDGWGDNAILSTIEANKMDTIKFIMSVENVKKKCVEDKDELHAILSKLNECFNDEIAKYLMMDLNLTESVLNDLKEYEEIDVSKLLPLL